MKELDWKNIFWFVVLVESILGVLWFLISPKTYGRWFRKMYDGLGFKFPAFDDEDN